MPVIRAVCFDMDGLLVDSERYGGQMLALAAGLPEDALNETQWRSLLGSSMEDTCDAMKRWFPGVDCDELTKAWPRVTLEWMHKHGLPVKPGADEALRALKQRGIKLALCSSNEPEVVQEYLRMAGWTELFDHIVSGRDVAHGKPAPDIYLKGAKLMGVPPKDCAGVEDSANGVKAVHAAGMRSVMVPDMLPYTHALAEYVDVVIPDLHSLLDALELE